jgi:hypothetical protein
MGALLTTASTLMCPHGGTVSVITSNARASAGGAFLVRASDTFVIVGCTFQISGAPHPCVQVHWIVNDLRSQVLSDFTLCEASVGLCVAADQAPQGTVIISNTQQQVTGQ